MRTIAFGFGFIIIAITIGNCVGGTIQDQIQPASQDQVEEIEVSQGE